MPDVGADRDNRSADGRASSLVSLIIPTRGAAGKSRLLAPAGVEHTVLARALATDTIAAALGCPGVGRVVIVTEDDDVVAAGLSARVARLADPRAGLGAAVLAGLSVARSTAAPYDVIGVLLGDLPALRAQDLERALRALTTACHHRGDGGPSDGSGDARGGGPARAAFVPDHLGTGTVLLVGRGDGLRPEFGPGSAGRHSRWARRLDLAIPRLRRDVDDAADLAAAIALGVGPATRAALRLPPDTASC